MSDQGDLRQKIDEAKWRLPLPKLLSRLGLGEHAKKEAHCPFHHPDKHKSFSVFQGNDGWWHYKCFAGCGDGDEIMFLSKRKGVGLTRAMNLYLEMAGFPPSRHPKSREYPQSRESREFPWSHECPESLKSPESPVHPVSNGQGIENELNELAVRNACTRAGDRTERKRFKLARDVRGLEERLGRKLPPELVLYEWHRLSQPFLNPVETRDDHLAAFLAELAKVREDK